MGRDWSKYSKKYNSDWEKDPLFSNWIQRAPDEFINQGKSEAFCKLCKKCFTPQKNDLIAHKNTQTHKQHEKALPSTSQPQLNKFGFDYSGSAKVSEKKTDMKLAVLVACHASIRSMDHLNEVLKVLGKNSVLADVRMHRTKCSKVIERVIVPVLRDDLVEDVADSYYSAIVDESTDHSLLKLLAICIKYYSRKEKRMVTAFLGLVETPRAGAEDLYTAFTTFMQTLGLNLKRLLGIGTDGGQNLCGRNHSLYALLKRRDCPHLLLVKCACHSLDKCASNASLQLPSTLELMIRESRGWFSHSAYVKELVLDNFEMFGFDPPMLVKLATTRWLSFYGAVKTHLAQYNALEALFTNAATDKCPAAVQLAALHKDGANLLYLTFLAPVLQQLTRMNLLFQSSNADLTRAFTDLRVYVFSVAGKVLKDEALRQSGQPGMLRLTELEALRNALNNKDNLRPLELVNYGDGFLTLAINMERSGALSTAKIREVKANCANFLSTLSIQLAQRLPDCIQDMEKKRNLAPDRVLAARGRPSFQSLPINLIPHSFDRDDLEDQWERLGKEKFEEICPGEDMTTIDTVQFWSLCLDLKNGAGDCPYEKIAFCALSLLSLPLSNALVERVFSIMNIVKNKIRNKMSVSMLNAILFLRLWLKAFNKCCTSFEPSDAMVRKFNSRVMYASNSPQTAGGEDQPGAAANNDEDVDGDLLDRDALQFGDDPEAIDAVLDMLEADTDITSLLT
ncbi:Zinc finger MYM-type protein 1 [Frankliniella fusca]|uniref:Zinc finger MYM-type protein 1 n=1 Tax=Frankliniella fusca TaxID=407009 RepID=A0AAE1H7E3_9NEOP|nr:Zinc finger MYM-type protein 1 [Frankliniella fusca]